jgi:L-fucose isomerase-like protein
MKVTLAVIVGNRALFPDHLVTSAREEIERLFDELDLGLVMLGENATKLGGVETYADAQKCAGHFRAHRAHIDGVVVVLPNFGDERGVADTLKLANLNVPVLVQAYPDDLARLSPAQRRDGFCGKISVCGNLRQYRIPFSLTRQHIIGVDTEGFRADLSWFAAVCRVVRGMRRARLGAVGARPAAFNTVRYSEKILEANGVSVTTIDLSDVFGVAGKLGDDNPRVKAKVGQIRAYAKSDAVPDEKLLLLAKLAVVLSDWMAANELDATAMQCWTSIQRNYGVNPCVLMSMMSEHLLPSACEVDVTGALSMYALQLASGSPSALADWNNNYADDEDKCILFHCGNWARSFLPDAEICPAPILGAGVGMDNTWGALEGRTAAGPVTFGRITTDDPLGRIRAYLAEGRFTEDDVETFGSRAVVWLPGLQRLLKYICRMGFEHHVAMNASQTADVLVEAFETYLGWAVYRHEGPTA